MTRDDEARVIDTVFIAIRLAYQLAYLLQHSKRLLSALLKNLDLFHRACLSEFESRLDKYHVEGNGGWLKVNLASFLWFSTSTTIDAASVDIGSAASL